MMRALFAGVLLVAAAPAFAASPFDGTWKGDVASAKLDQKPEVFEISNGRYTCPTCAPAVTVAADGAIHPVAGHSYFDALAVRVVDPKTVNYRYMLKGKMVSDTTDTVSDDGNTLTTAYTSTNNAKGMPVSGTAISRRASAAPAGAHASSGGWVSTNASKPAEENLTIMLTMAGDTFSLRTLTGEHYTAKLGGPPVPLVGDRAGTMIKVARGAGGSIVETDMIAGKVDTIYTYSPTSDPTRLTMRAESKRRGTVDVVTLLKQ